MNIKVRCGQSWEEFSCFVDAAPLRKFPKRQPQSQWSFCVRIKLLLSGKKKAKGDTRGAQRDFKKVLKTQSNTARVNQRLRGWEKKKKTRYAFNSGACQGGCPCKKCAPKRSNQSHNSLQSLNEDGCFTVQTGKWKIHTKYGRLKALELNGGVCNPLPGLRKS